MSLRSQRINQQYANEYVQMVKKIIGIINHFPGLTSTKQRTTYLVEIYRMVNTQFIPLIIAMKHIKPCIQRFLLMMEKKIDEHTTSILLAYRVNILPKTLVNTTISQFKQYRRKLNKYKYDNYYKLWVIRQTFPYELYRTISEYYTHQYPIVQNMDSNQSEPL